MRYIFLCLLLFSVSFPLDEAAWIETTVVDSFGKPIEGVFVELCCPSGPTSYFSCRYAGNTDKEGVARFSCMFCNPSKTAEIRVYYGSRNYSSYFSWHGYSGLPLPKGCYTYDPLVPHYSVKIIAETANLYLYAYDNEKPLKNVNVEVSCSSRLPPNYFQGRTDANGSVLIRSIPKYTECVVKADMFGKISYNEKMVFDEDEKTIVLGNPGASLTIKLQDSYGEGLDGSAKIFDGTSTFWVDIANGSGMKTLPKGEYLITAIYFNRSVGSQKIFVENNTEVLFIVAESNCEGVKNGECSHEGEYCYFGRLVKNCEKCRCLAGYFCNKHPEVYGGVCCKIGEYFDGKKCSEGKEKFKIFYVPINVDVDDENFLSVVTTQGEFVVKNYDLTPSSIKIVDEAMHVTREECGFLRRVELVSIDLHFKKWYAKKTGFIESLLYTKYRVVGYDRFNTCATDFCAYTYRSNSPVYIGGLPCSHYFSVSAHEIGHTFRLCDTYNPNVWALQHILSLCPNQPPTPENSECINCDASGVCCLGIRISNYTYDIMGSADRYKNGMTVDRKFTDEDYEYIQNQLRWMK